MERFLRWAKGQSWARAAQCCYFVLHGEIRVEITRECSKIKMAAALGCVGIFGVKPDLGSPPPSSASDKQSKQRMHRLAYFAAGSALQKLFPTYRKPAICLYPAGK